MSKVKKTKMPNFLLVGAKMMMFAIAITLVFASCGGDDNKGKLPIDPEYPFANAYFGIKAGTIVYSTENYLDEENSDIKIIFDDYGKKFRYETHEIVMISDEDAQKQYTLLPATRQYTEVGYGMSSLRYGFTYIGDEVNLVWQYYPDFSKSNRTIAGKNCSVCKWTDEDDEKWEWGGWQRITFLYSVIRDSQVEKFEAKSIIESAPANSFVPPSDYTKI